MSRLLHWATSGHPSKKKLQPDESYEEQTIHHLLNVIFVELVVVGVPDVGHFPLHVRQGGQLQVPAGHCLHPLLELGVCEVLIRHKLQAVDPLCGTMSESERERSG